MGIFVGRETQMRETGGERPADPCRLAKSLASPQFDDKIETGRNEAAFGTRSEEQRGQDREDM